LFFLHLNLTVGLDIWCCFVLHLSLTVGLDTSPSVQPYNQTQFRCKTKQHQVSKPRVKLRCKTKQHLLHPSLTEVGHLVLLCSTSELDCGVGHLVLFCFISEFNCGVGHLVLLCFTSAFD
jgi:hypothetical protein